MTTQEQKPKFDPDLTPFHEANREAAKVHHVRYEPRKQCYVDVDGCPRFDSLGQPL